MFPIKITRLQNPKKEYPIRSENKRITETYPSNAPLQYPLTFPHRFDGYNISIQETYWQYKKCQSHSIMNFN